MESLGKVFPVGAYPFEDGTPRDWISPVSDWLVGLARHAIKFLPFELAVIGWEIDNPNGDAIPTEVPSEERWCGYLKRIGTELVWFPPTVNHPPMTISGVR